MAKHRRRPVPASPGPHAPSATPAPRWAAPAILGGFAALFITLAAASFWNTSATWDEPIHLTSGYAAVASHDLRIDPSHPPLLRMWAALPLLAMEPALDTRRIDTTPPTTWLGDAYAFAHDFMYVDNDADRMLRAARLMVVLLGVLLGVLVFCWAREWLGLLPAAAALMLFVVEPNLVAHSSLVTTDLGVTTFLFGAAYFLWRTTRQASWFNIAAFCACAGLAATAKFSAILLAPVVAVLLLFAVVRRMLPLRTAALVVALALAAGVTAIWASYGFRYLPSDSPAWTFDLTATRLASRAPALASAVGWIDEHHLLPNAYVQGFLYTQSSQEAPGFLAGDYGTSGWWYYFPVAFLIKTPIATILLAALGVAALAMRRRGWTAGPVPFIVVPIAVFLGVAMQSGINIGLRHILPIYPFVLLLAAAAAGTLLSRRWRPGPALLAALLVAGAAEFAAAYPHPLSFFNHVVGGPEHGFKYLADSNLGWGQNLKGLKAWMEDEGVSHVNLAYFGQADPAYYDIDVTHLPGAPGFATDLIARPKLPGYVAISPTILQGVYAPPHWRLWYAPFADLEPVTVIGHSLRVYWIEEWPHPGTPTRTAADRQAYRTLADALLFGLQWPERAAQRYREYLRVHPRDADAHVNFGLALASQGRLGEARAQFEQAMEIDPAHAQARAYAGRLTAAR